jgi:hypothetical protein
MRKLTLALLIAATPAAAQTAGESLREVRFQGATFTCGLTNDGARTMQVAPSTMSLPAREPSPQDPQAKSWSIVYKLICEQAYERLASIRQDPKQAAAAKPNAKTAKARSPERILREQVALARRAEKARKPLPSLLSMF